MTQFSDELLAEYVLGHLSESDAAAIEAEAANSAVLRSSIDEIAGLLTGVAFSLPEAGPSIAVRERLIASCENTNRFEQFASRVGELIDVAKDKAERLLAAIDSATSWGDGPIPGMSLYHLDGGPSVSNAVVGFIRLEAGLGFPTHTHLGDEIVLVLQGRCTDEDGTVSEVGDEIVKASGTTHAFATDPDGPDFVYLAVVQEGVEIGDMVFRPGDPGL